MSALSQISVQQFLEKVKAQGIHLQANGDRIHIGWPEKTPDQKIRQTIINRKAEVLEALDGESGCPAFFDHLNETSREAFREYVELMTGPKFRMPLDQAQQEAMHLVIRNLRTLQIQQATKEYRKQGWIKIFSTVLNRAVYLAKHEQAAKRVPDRDIPAYTESDIEAVKGLDPEVAKVLLEARILFGGPIKKGHDLT